MNFFLNPVWSLSRLIWDFKGVFSSAWDLSVWEGEGGETQATQKATLFPRGPMLHPAMNGVLKNIILVTRLIFRPSQPHHFVCRLRALCVSKCSNWPHNKLSERQGFSSSDQKLHEWEVDVSLGGWHASFCCCLALACAGLWLFFRLLQKRK